jgi:hypothetical protein
MTDDLATFIRDTEASMFRTDMDYGANPNALGVWNQVRKFAGLVPLTKRDLTENHLKTKVEDLIFSCGEEDLDAVQKNLNDILQLASCIADGETMSARIKKMQVGPAHLRNDIPLHRVVLHQA